MFYIYVMIFLSVCSISSGNVELECQPGWHEYDNQCYWFSNVKTTRVDAKQACILSNSTLVTIGRKDVNEFLEKQIVNGGNLSYWIGLKMTTVAPSAWQWNNGRNLGKVGLEWCPFDTPYTGCAAIVYGLTTDITACIRSYICSSDRLFVCVKDKLSTCGTWTEFGSDGTGTTKCFYINSSKTSQMEASRYCLERQAMLVTIPTYNTLAFLSRTRSLNDNVHWIGFSPYKWDNDEIAYNWNNWDKNGPHIFEACTTLLPSGMWTSGNCTTEMHNFICEKDSMLRQGTTPSQGTTQTVIHNSMVQTTTTSSIVNTSPSITTAIASEIEVTTLNDTEYTVLEIAGTTITSNNERQILLYLLIGIYSAVGVTTIVFIGLLVKYISLRRRHKMDSEKPIEVELDAGNANGDDDYKLYDNPDYVGVEHQEQCTSAETSKSPASVNDSLIYSETPVPSKVVSTNTHTGMETKRVPTSRDDDVALGDISLDTKHH